MTGDAQRVIGAGDGVTGFLGSIGVRFLLGGADTGSGFALVEHTLSARALAAPLHRHTHEDEHSFVLGGRIAALLGGLEVEGGPGDLIVKPRGEWHTFWNPGEEPARILEIISPAGFEGFFAEFVALEGRTRDEPQLLDDLCERYALELDHESVAGLVERYGLQFPGTPV